MMLYMKIRGVPGALVSDPRSAIGAPRYLGKSRKPDHTPHVGALDDHFDEIEQVIECTARHQTKRLIMKAVAHGHLELLGSCQAADIHAAIAKLGE